MGGIMTQPNLERPIQMLFRVSERERDFIYKKMALAKTKNKTAYLRKMAIDGYILNVNYSEFKELFATIGRIGGSINQIAKRINATQNVYSDDIAEVKKRQEEVWQLLKSMQSKLL
jgi:DNA invertase Pin-like site-specific DNA recombinase